MPRERHHPRPQGRTHLLLVQGLTLAGFLDSSQHENLSDAIDWRQYVPSMGILGDMLEDGIYESDHWTYSHGCKKPSRGAAGTSGLLAWDAAFEAVDEPCEDDEEVTKGDRKLPLNLQWNADEGALAFATVTFVLVDYKSGCEGSTRVTEVNYGTDAAPTYLTPAASYHQALEDGECHVDQNHVRAYEIIPDEIVVGQAHFEHWHWYGWFRCNHVRHCVHDISDLEEAIGEEFDANCWDSHEATSPQVSGGPDEFKIHAGGTYDHNYRLTHMTRECY